MDSLPATTRLTINQRNLYAYLLHHKKKHRAAPCFVPRMPMHNSRLPDYLRAIEALEEKGLITVSRDALAYTGWIIDLPKRKLDKPAQMD